ncbi:MAG: TraR/DksA C4-type zinc finger protein [Abditibacteriales bacterium]|nr:TraR/DksA C4-type zinc finger protein [Abditibacteriales bacterium]
MNKKHFQALLEEEKSKVMRERQRLRKGWKGDDRSVWLEEGAEDESASADAATALMEKEQDLLHWNELQQRLNDINRALERLREGTYGICEMCGQPIKPARLEALPWTTLCLNCRELVGG